MEKDFMLTTVDNPFNPFTQFDEWRVYDEQQGYYTCEYLARIAHTSSRLSDKDNSLEIKNAMNEICGFHPSLYKIVYRP